MNQSFSSADGDERVNSSTAARIYIDGNKFELRELENRLKYGLEKCRMKDMTQISERMRRTEGRIQQYDDEDRGTEAEQERRYLNELKQLQVLKEEISVKYTVLLSKNIDKLELSELEDRLRYGVEKCRIKDMTQLSERMTRAEERIQQYQHEDRNAEAEQEMRYMRDLEHLRRVTEEILFRKSSSPTVKTDAEAKERMELKNLRDDVARMPCCAEKTTMKFLAYFQQKFLRDSINDNASELVTPSLEDLQDQLQREELFSEQIRASLQDLKRTIHNEDWSSTVGVLSKILNRIRPLHVQEIERLMDKTKNTAGLINGRDVILLVGITGSGKSTTIQFLAGAKMKETRIEIAPGKFLEHITVDGPVRNAGLNCVTSSPLSKSETRYIVPVTVQLQDILGQHQTGEITLCDAPGFGDTAGPEVDIANSIGVMEALKNCKSVKILALSSYRSLGDRGEGIQKLVRLLINMIDGIEDRLYGVLYAFTKYPPTTDVHALLTDIKRSQVDEDPILRSNGAVATVFTDMIDKTRQNAEKIDPIGGDPKSLIKKLMSLQGIHYPGEVFRFSMSEETQSAITNQTQKYKSSIMCAIKRKDIDLVMYYLNSLKVLSDWVKQSSVRDGYKDSIEFLSENIRQHYTATMEKFNRHVVSQDGLRDEDIREYKTAHDYVQQVQALREHLGSELVSTEILIENILSTLEERSFALQKESLDSPTIGIYLNNFRMLQNSVKELESSYLKTCQDFAKRFQSTLVEPVPQLISSNKFKEVADIISIISKCLPVLNHHVNEEVEESYRRIVSLVLQHLTHFSEEADSVLSKIILSKSDIEILQNYINLLRSAKKDIAIQTVKDLNQVYEGLIGKIIKHFDEMNKRIRELFEKSGNHALEHIEQSIIQMEMIRTLPDIESKTDRAFYHTIQDIRGYMKQWQREAEELFSSLDHQSGVINFRPLVRSLARLRNTQWIDHIYPGTSDSLIRDIREQLEERAGQLENRLKKLDLSLKSPQNVRLAQEIIEKSESMEALEPSIPELKKYRDRINQSFAQTTKEVFDYIQKTFDLSDKTTSQVKQELIELEQIKKEYNQLYPARIYLRKLGYADIHALNRAIQNLKMQQEAELEKAETEKRRMESQLHDGILTSTKIDRRMFDRLFAKIGIGFQRLQHHPDEYLQQKRTPFSDTISHLESITEDYSSLVASSYLVSPKEKDFLQERGQTSYELLEKTIEEKKKTLTEDEQYRQTYYFRDNLDASVANNSLIYISNCEKVGHHDVKEMAVETEEFLRRYLEEYGNFLDKEIERHFKRITSIDESDPVQYSENLEKRFEELSSLDKYALVFENLHGAEKIERWNRQFFNQHRSLETDMEICKIDCRSREFRRFLMIAQALSCVDRFCTVKLADKGFGTLYRHYQSDVARSSQEVYTRVIEHIAKGDYAKVYLALSDVVENSLSSKFLTRIKNDLQCSVSRMMKDTKIWALWLDGKIDREEEHREKIREINENMEKIRIVLNRGSIVKLLDDPTKSALQKFELEMNQILETVISNGIKNIELYIDGNSFFEAAQCMQNLLHVQYELAGHYASKLIDAKIEKIKTRLDSLPRDILERYDFADLNSYAMNPPKDLLAQLKRAASGGYAKYVEVCTPFTNNVRTNFELAIDSVNNKLLNDRSAKIRSIKYAFHFLPDELKALFQPRIDQLNQVKIDGNTSSGFD